MPFGLKVNRTTIPLTTRPSSHSASLQETKRLLWDGLTVKPHGVRWWSGVPCGDTPLTTLFRNIVWNGFLFPPLIVDCKFASEGGWVLVWMDNKMCIAATGQTLWAYFGTYSYSALARESNQLADSVDSTGLLGPDKRYERPNHCMSGARLTYH